VVSADSDHRLSSPIFRIGGLVIRDWLAAFVEVVVRRSNPCPITKQERPPNLSRRFSQRCQFDVSALVMRSVFFGFHISPRAQGAQWGLRLVGLRLFALWNFTLTILADSMLFIVLVEDNAHVCALCCE